MPLEALTHYNTYRHGEAVSIGMNCAARLAANLGMLSETDFERQRTLLKQANLPLTFPPDIASETLCEAMYLDKKTLGGKLRLILPTRIGEVVIRDDVSDTQVVQASFTMLLVYRNPTLFNRKQDGRKFRRTIVGARSPRPLGLPLNPIIIRVYQRAASVLIGNI